MRNRVNSIRDPRFWLGIGFLDKWPHLYDWADEEILRQAMETTSMQTDMDRFAEIYSRYDFDDAPEYCHHRELKSLEARYEDILTNRGS